MPFIKGQSGNPGGRKKKYITELIEQIGKEIEPKSGKPFEELIARRLWVEAVNGKGEAIKEILNRVEGLPHQSTDITSGGEPITFNLDEVIGLSKSPTKTTAGSPAAIQK